MKTPYPAGQGVKVSKVINRFLPGGRQALINLSILKATYRESECSSVGVHEGNAAKEVEAASIRAANCTAPIDAIGTDIAERTIAVVAVARHGQFKR